MSQSPLEFLFSLERFGMKFGLANMARLSEALGHPDASFAPVIVGGTNGKGSVTVMTETALRAAGHRVARYTSPHLTRLEERFVIDGREVETRALEAAAARVQRVAEDLVTSGALQSLPTFFECTTAIAFDLFRDAKVEIAVLEVGLGGRLDATNIVSPVAAAIVSIDFDHEAQLGHTLTAIAAEKAGIVRRGIPVVCGRVPDEARAVIAEVCDREGARLIRSDLDVAISASGPGRLTFVTPRLTLRRGPPGVGRRAPGWQRRRRAPPAGRAGRPRLHDGSRCGASGPHASRVARTARAIHDRRAAPCSSTPLTIRPGHARWRPTCGRPAPMAQPLVFGAMKDKAVVEMLEALAPVAALTICTTAPTPRAMGADALAELARSTHAHVEVERDPFAAVARACAAGPRLVVVAGSIFLVGPVRDRLAHGILR